MEKISVLMGIYNCSSTLVRALDSLLNQTFEAWKCILCDDGSEDDTYKVAESYVKRFPQKFILIKNETNQGLNVTLNNCLELADTEYVARMDGDDISLPERFEKEIAFLDSHSEYDIVSTPMIHFDENGDFRRGVAIEKPTPQQIAIGSAICHAPCMIRTAAIKAVGGYSTDPTTMRVEDVDLWIRMYTNGSSCYNLSEPLYKMQDGREATSRRKFRYRVNSTRVRLRGCKSLKLGLICYIRAFRPILVGLLPTPIYNILHKKNVNK